MKTALILTIALSATPVLAGDCPQPKRLTCEQLQNKMIERCPQRYDDPKDCDCNCPEATVVEKAIEVLAPSPTIIKEVPGETKYIFQDSPMPPPKGRPLMRYGASYVDGPGLQLGGGYRFKNGIDIVGSLNYHRDHGNDIDAYLKSGPQNCPRYTAVHYPVGKNNVGIGFDITIPIGGN